jgi:antirestriction protein ArdC
MAKQKYDPDEAQAKREALQEKLADGIDQLVTSDEWRRYLDFQKRFHKYSFGNTLLIMLQRPDATMVMGYGYRDKKTQKPLSGWLALGRNVRKGETGIQIWAPVRRKVDVTDADGNVRYGPDGKPRKREQIVGWRIVRVFDVAQTEGDPIPEPVKELTGQDTRGMYDRLVKVAAGIGYPVEYADLGRTDGATSDSPARIRINPNREPVHQVATLIHELAHATLHKGIDDYRVHRGRYELEAESVAYIVAGWFGIDTSTNSFGYVAGWASAEDRDRTTEDADMSEGQKVRELIKNSGQAIQRAAASILDGLEKE